VQARIRHDGADVIRLLEAGGRIAVYVPEHVRHGVRQTLVGIVKEGIPELQGADVEDADAEEWLDGAWLAWKSRTGT
jgi:hypothetical protein